MMDREYEWMNMIDFEDWVPMSSSVLPLLFFFPDPFPFSDSGITQHISIFFTPAQFSSNQYT